MKKKELLKQSRKLAAVITAVAIMDAPVVYGAELSVSENQQEASTEESSTVEETSEKEDNSEEKKSTEAEVSEESSVEETTTEEENVQKEATEEEENHEEEKTIEEATEEKNIVEAGSEEKTTEDETTSEEDLLTEEKTSEEGNAEESIPEENTDEEEKNTEGAPAEELPSEGESTASEEVLPETTSLQEDITEEMSEEPESGWFQDGDNWYFYEDGEKVTNCEITISGKEYRFDEAGRRLTNQWYEDNYEDRFYYLSDGSRAVYFQEIDGETYYFNSDGILEKNTAFEENDRESGIYKFYRTDENGKLIKGWYESGSSKYYCWSDGSCASGVQTIDGKTYLFDERGQMQTSTAIVSEGYLYCFGEDGVQQTKQSLEKDGWIKVGVNWFYAKNNQLVKDELLTVGQYTYYMDESGKMCTDTEFRFYDEAEDENKYYRVDKDGHLVKGWYKGNYFGEDGEERTACYYYLSDGSRAEGFQEINGELYYFDTDYGTLWINGAFEIYDRINGSSKFYRADENGKLIRGWYENGSDKYYCWSDGSCASGVQTIDGKTYLFNEQGEMQTDIIKVFDGYLYYFGEDGVQQTKQSLEKDGWIKIGENWFYAKNNNLVKDEFLTVGQYTYYMDKDGKMCTDTVLELFDEEEGDDKYYRVDKEGHLVKGWYKDGNDWYYFDVDGGAARGILTINGKTYLFDFWGKMQTDIIKVSDGYVYYFGEDGVQQTKQSVESDGWLKAGNNWFYVKNNELVKDEFLTVGNYVYYIDEKGKMMSDQVFWHTDGNADQDNDENLYYADASGHIVIGGWKKLMVDSEINWYYFDLNGCAKHGIQEINGKTYYFDSKCKMKTDYTVVENGYLWHFGDDGIQNVKWDLNINGWIKIGDNWYYVFENELLRNTTQKIGDFTYAFGYNGQMEVDEIGWTDTGYYRTDEKGHVVIGWYKDEKRDCWYYYGKDGRSLEGLATVNNNLYCFSRRGEMLTNYAYKSGNILYYFGEDGKLSTSLDVTTDGWKKLSNGYYYVKDGELITQQLLKVGQYIYYFEDDGHMAESTAVWANGNIYYFDSQGHMVTGWYKSGSSWYYYDNNGQPLSGVQKIGNKLYYLSDFGLMYQNKKVFCDGKLYTFGTNGVGEVYTKSGWTNNTYYIENGKPVTGWKKISDKWYYFDTENGEKCSSGVYKINNANYYFNAYGEMQTGSFKTKDGLKLFAGADGKIQEDGWYKNSDGKWYYIDDANCVSGVVYINGKCNLFRADGSWIKEIPLMEKGWVNCDGTYYYLEKGKIVCADNKFINGQLYFFDKTGKMLKNQLYEGYYLQNSGAALINGWAEDINEPGTVRYFGDDGKCIQEGWKKINGNWYYFESDGYRTGKRVQEDKLIDGKIYHFDVNGVSDGKGIAVVNGWNLIGGNYYYVENNKFIKGPKTINGKRYFFDYQDGAMVRNEYRQAAINSHDMYSSYYIDANGEIVTDKWCEDDLYAGSDGIIYEGLKTINGKTYLFSTATRARLYHNCSVASLDGKTVYTTNSNGEVVQSQNVKKDGWLKTSDGMWFYAKDGKFVRDQLLTINGKDYYFTYEGNMLVSGIFYDSSSNTGYADQNGNVFYEGWFGSKYFGKRVNNGTLEINGKCYLFIDGYSTAGYELVDGEYYYFDGKGNKTLKTFTTGWNKVGTDWYYISDANEMYRNKSVKIGNEYYHFDDHGVMATNYLYCGNYYGSNGTRIKNCWKQIDGNWYYFDANGKALTGKRQINGKWYIFGSDGCMLA